MPCRPCEEKKAMSKSAKVEGQPVERAERETIVVSQRTKRLQARGLAALEQSRAAESKASEPVRADADA
jgi:hypothetical protein